MYVIEKERRYKFTSNWSTCNVHAAWHDQMQWKAAFQWHGMYAKYTMPMHANIQFRFCPMFKLAAHSSSNEKNPPQIKIRKMC